jgi:hypothetical protein
LKKGGGMTQFNKDFSTRAKDTFRESDSFDLEDRLRPNPINQTDPFYDDYDPSYNDEYQTRKNYYGIGPKGYKRSDMRLKEEAYLLLNQDPILDSSSIQIDVLNNVIYLKGVVDSRRDKKRAEVLIEDIYGIEDVQNQLKIVR